jgi:cation diffusion facilitator CzcD-associated flavoprotein CzcO
MPEHYRAVIVGAGQAGLAAAHELLVRGFTPWEDFIVLDANEAPGGAWRHRWDSLTLGRAHGIADLPGMPFGRADETVPASVVVAKYYGDYEREFGLPVLRPAGVLAVTSPEGIREGPLHVEFDHDGPRTLTTDFLLNATGTWDNPFVPHIPGIDRFEGKQLHTVGYEKAEDFRGRRTLVVGGGLSAVQFLLELGEVTDTIWATRRPPNFTDRGFDAGWGLDVERAVRERTFAGRPAASVVRTTGIPLWEPYVAGVRSGLLVSRGMIARILPDRVSFGAPDSELADGLGPSGSDRLVLPESWQPFPAGHEERVDVIFWNTGFRPALRHLAPLKLRSSGGGVRMADEVSVADDSRVLLVGYGSTASTVGATRAGRLAGKLVARRAG